MPGHIEHTADMGTAADAHWAAVSRASQLQVPSAPEWPGWDLRPPRALRLRLGLLLVRAGLRVAKPLTVDVTHP